MCGITGFVSRTGVRGLPESQARQTAIVSLKHRGPDSQGEYADAAVWLGHTRLSILDLSPCGNQPMATPDGRFVVCFNGEIYNFRELAASLALRDLQSQSDTEVLLRCFERVGTAAFLRFNGIFAFALYDRTAQKVWLVRDRLGVKPLYYREGSRGLAFGSEIKAITALDGAASVCDVSSLHEWLYYGNALGGRTLYEGVKQLVPGHYLEMDVASGTCRIEQYWSLRDETAVPLEVDAPLRTVIPETRRLLDQAVRRQLVSDVPIGVFLSGGVDSSAITAFASRHQGGSRLATYSVGFDDPAAADERPKARRVADHFGTNHHELQIGGDDVAALVELMVHHHDLPFSDAANIPLYLMASQISSHTKVVLQGDGGDEVFGGYRRYVTLRHHRWLRPLARWAQRLDGRQPATGLRHRVQRYLHAYAAGDLGSTMALLLTLEDAHSHPAAIFQSPLRERVEAADPFARYRQCQAWFAERDIANQMSMVDLMVELPDIFLEKVDRATMAASLEVRVPFLDDDLVTYVARIAGPAKMPGGRKKWLLKQALAGIVPNDVLNAPKSGFNVPFGHWLRTSLKPLFFDQLATFSARCPAVLDSDLLRTWYADTEAGRPEHDYMLWKVLNFLVWCNNSRIEISACA